MEYRIINFMQENNYMYDKTTPLYKCKNTKEQKWAELSQELGIGVIELQKRWRTLRDRFLREVKKNVESGGSRVTKWKYYKLLSFLRDYYGETEVPYLGNEDFTIQPEEPFDHQYADTKNLRNIKISSETLLSNGYTRKQNQFSKRKKVQTDQPSKRELLEEFSSLLDKARGTLNSTSMVKAFFNSMAIQVEEANLAFERFAYVQQEVLRIVNEQIKEQRQEQGSNNGAYENFSDV